MIFGTQTASFAPCDVCYPMLVLKCGRVLLKYITCRRQYINVAGRTSDLCCVDNDTGI